MFKAINRYLEEKRAVQEATYPLERLIYCEELCIENAIESAKLKIKEQQLSPAAREHKEKFLVHRRSAWSFSRLRLRLRPDFRAQG